MIQTDFGLKATRAVVANLEDALRDLIRKQATYHPKTFALIAAPIVDAIRAHRAEIDEYIGLLPDLLPVAPANGPLVPA